MSRMRFVDEGPPPTIGKVVLTRLFDLLLLCGYVACLLLTYSFFASLNHHPPESKKPAVAARTKSAPPPSPALTPTPPPLPTSQDLIEAMHRYANLINDKKYTEALAMRADNSIPVVDTLKSVTHFEVVSVKPYPRVKRDQGSIYVELKVERGKNIKTWKGRVDWEQRGERWVTTNWDGAALTPGAETGAGPAPAGTQPVVEEND